MPAASNNSVTKRRNIACHNFNNDDSVQNSKIIPFKDTINKITSYG